MEMLGLVQHQSFKKEFFIVVEQIVGKGVQFSIVRGMVTFLARRIINCQIHILTSLSP
jgi:hypothetical protein